MGAARCGTIDLPGARESRNGSPARFAISPAVRLPKLPLGVQTTISDGRPRCCAQRRPPRSAVRGCKALGAEPGHARHIGEIAGNQRQYARRQKREQPGYESCDGKRGSGHS